MPGDNAALTALIREFLRGSPSSDIHVCELRERDVNELFIYLKHKDGRELRLACPTDEAPMTHALIKGWIARPATLPAPEPLLSATRLRPALWAAFALASAAAAWLGARDYWLVIGWAFTSHILGGMTLSIVVFTVFWLSISSNPLPPIRYLTASPLLIAMTLVFTSAGKAVNARFGAQELIEVRGRVVAMDDASFTAYFNRGRGRSLSGVLIARWHITVQDERDGRMHRIEVPGWVASRHKLSIGSLWEDRYYRGVLGWLYRKSAAGGGWDGFDFVPRVTPAS